MGHCPGTFPLLSWPCTYPEAATRTGIKLLKCHRKLVSGEGPTRPIFHNFGGILIIFSLFLLFPLCPDNHQLCEASAQRMGGEASQILRETRTSSLRTGEGGRFSGEEAPMVNWACREHTPDTSVGPVPPGPSHPHRC